MNILLDVCNFILILFFAWVCIFLQSTLFHDFFGIYKPNMLLVILAYLALNRFLIEGGVLAFFMGYFVELNSGAPFGLYSCVFVLTFYAAKLICEGFYIKTALAEIGLVCAVVLSYKILYLLVYSIYASIQWQVGTLIGVTFSTLGLNVLLSPLIFLILKQLDENFSKDRPFKTGTQDPAVRLH